MTLSACAFYTRAINECPQGEAVARILAASIQAVEPGSSVRRFVQRAGNALLVDQQEYRLDEIGQIRILGLGKAALGMSQALVEMLEGFSYRGLLIPKYELTQALSQFAVFPGGHPIPDKNSLIAAQQAIHLVSGLSERDLLICLISGGGSALMTAPVQGVSLADIQALTAILLASGARIDEINVLRRRLDQLKGGGLAKLAVPARIISLILSDVVGSPLEVIASGPTAPDPSYRADVLGMLDKYAIRQQVPKTLLAALENTPETPKPGNAIFDRVQNLVVGSNLQAAQAALQQAQTEGFIAPASTDNSVKGFINSSDKSVEIGMERGSMIVQTENGSQTVNAGQSILLAQADVPSNNPAPGNKEEEDDDKGAVGWWASLGTGGQVALAGGVIVGGAFVINEVVDDDDATTNVAPPPPPPEEPNWPPSTNQ